LLVPSSIATSSMSEEGKSRAGGEDIVLGVEEDTRRDAFNCQFRAGILYLSRTSRPPA